MTMALGSGSAGTASAGIASSSSSTNIGQGPVSAVSPVSDFSQRTQGSVFNQAGNFGDLTFKNPTVMNRQSSSNSKPRQQNQAGIGNLLAGNFGSLTASSSAVANISSPQTSRNTDQDHTKTSDQMLEVANNLTMKDMWAAA